MDRRSPLLTERLTLRPFTRTDIPGLVAGLAPFEVAGWLSNVAHPYTEADARAFLARLAAGDPGLEVYAIDDGQGLVGGIGIGDWLSYWLAGPFQGRGYATEAAGTLVGHYFAVTDAASLDAGHFEGNWPSHHVLEKLGFVPNGEKKVYSIA